MENNTNQKGYVIIMSAFFVLIIMSSMALSMGFLIAGRQKSMTNTVKSTQSYYAAEAGVEDALLRLKKYPQITAINYNLNVNNISTNIDISNSVNVSKTIVTQASNYGMTRKIKATCTISNVQGVSFYYGIEVGDGGLVMNNGSEVMGNVFSGGNISGSGIIDNDAIVSGNGHSIQGVHIKGDAYAYSCLSGATVDGKLTYVTGGTHDCTVNGGSSGQAQEILEQPLPIKQSEIDGWKADASAVCSSTDVNNLKSNNKTVSMGPCRVNGDLIFGNGDTLTLTGTIYVTGTIIFGNTDTIKLGSSYGPSGGIFLSDGTINTGNGNTFFGSGQAGSYLLIISTSASDSAIIISNNSGGAAFYTSAGGLTISNNVSVAEATGYKLIMNNNTKIQYSNGIVNIYFASGPSGGWKVTSWQEY